ncbi:motility associated factor glycosyltransferase family protein [Paenibacillus sp. KN14-4R]|uniref:motility associated factor glycosyltransferase family protein n=1 Tax=Paenibacillus sp. KN14-4R TaxID=3445773 RepID=UPI003F9EF24D
MNTNLKLNLAVLKKKFPNIYKFAQGKDFNIAKYSILEAKNHQSIVAVNMDQSITFLHSKYNPTNEAKNWVNSIEDSVVEMKNILVFGFGAGYHIQTLLERFPNKKIFIYEPDHELFLAALEARDISSIFDHANIVTFALGQEQSIRFGLLDSLSKNVTESFGYLILPVYNTLYSQVVEDFKQDATEILKRYSSNLSTFNSFQLEWPENILKNMAKNLGSPSIQGLASKCKGETAIIVGSGPSLQPDIEYLRKLKDHCLIIAAGSSIQALLHHKIEPHLVVSIDGGVANYRVFKDLDISHIPFLYVPMIKHEILHNYNDNLIHVMFTNDSITRHLFESVAEIPMFSSTSSVTGTAIQAALYLGCSRIVFMGQDLSYPNDQHYTAGVDHIDEEAIARTVKNATQWVDSVRDTKNRTTESMLVTLRDLESLMGCYQGAEYINTSKVGAKIAHTKWLPIEEVYEMESKNKLDSKWFKSLLESNLKRYDEATVIKIVKKIHQIQRETKSMIKKLEELLNELILLDSYAKEGKGDGEKLFSNVNKLWGSITNRQAFKTVFNFGLNHYIEVYMRYVPDIVEERNLRVKSNLIVKHLGPLVGNIAQSAPVYLSYMEDAVKQLNEQFVIASGGKR